MKRGSRRGHNDNGAPWSPCRRLRCGATAANCFHHERHHARRSRPSRGRRRDRRRACHFRCSWCDGPDARGFLDSQLTRNVPTVDDLASPVGYCSPKGRLLATFVMWRRRRRCRAARVAPNSPHRSRSGCGCTCCARRSRSTTRRAVARSTASSIRAYAPAPSRTMGRPARRRCDLAALSRRRGAPSLAAHRVARHVRPGRRRRRGDVAMARRPAGPADDRGRHAGPLRAADAEPRGARRRRLQEGLLPGSGSRRAQPVSRAS